MKNNVPFARRGRAATAATTAFTAAVLALSLAGCGDGTAGQGAASDQAPVASATSTPPATPPTDADDDSAAAPEADTTEEAEPEAAQDGSVALSDLGAKDDAPMIDFPGPEAAFPDGSSASSDGTTLNVTTAAEESFSLELPTGSEGVFYGIPVSLGDAGIGYMMTQTGGENLHTFLVVLNDGKLYLPKVDEDVVFGQFAGEGPFFETYTTNDGDHLVTKIKDSARTGDNTAYYEWAVEDGRMVPTQLS